MNRIYVFLRDNAFDMRACMLFLESFSASCFTHTLQLVSKDSLFLESNIGVLIAKALQTILTLQVFLVSSVSIQKLLLPLQDIKTRSSSTYLILKRLEKLKQVSKTTWLTTHNKFKPENILTADEWKLVTLHNELLEF